MFTQLAELLHAGKYADVDKMILDGAHKEAEMAKPVVEVPEVSTPAFEFADVPYRIHFKNGASGEYAGAVLARHFPFDREQIESIETVEGR